ALLGRGQGRRRPARPPEDRGVHGERGDGRDVRPEHVAPEVRRRGGAEPKGPRDHGEVWGMNSHASRREWFQSIGAGMLGAAATGRAMAASASEPEKVKTAGGSLALKDFEPRSALHAKETRVPKSRFPAIDAHSHLSETSGGSKGVAQGEEV